MSSPYEETSDPLVFGPSRPVPTPTKDRPAFPLWAARSGSFVRRDHAGSFIGTVFLRLLQFASLICLRPNIVLSCWEQRGVERQQPSTPHSVFALFAEARRVVSMAFVVIMDNATAGTCVEFLRERGPPVPSRYL